MPGTDGAFLSSQTRSECAGLFTKSRRTDPLAHFARVSPSARGRMTQQNERLYSPPRRGGEPPGAQRGGRGSVRRLFCAKRVQRFINSTAQRKAAFMPEASALPLPAIENAVP